MDDESVLAMEDVGSPDSPTEASHPGSASGARRSRVALACQRCKRRKQRCDGSLECKSCLKAGVTCVYERAIRPRYPGGKSLYINALEERIAFLEARMPEYGQDHFHAPSKARKQSGPDDQTPRQRKSTRGPSSDTASEEDDTTLVDGVAYLSLCASGTTDTAPEPFYVGSSSGATIARMIQASIFKSSRPTASPNPLSGSQPEVLRPTPAPLLSSPAFGDHVSEFPPRGQAQMLFTVFFDRLHTRWPILDRKLYLHIFDRQYDQGALPLQQRSIIHLIYAISARFLQLMKKPCQVDPERHFAAAIEPMDYILEQHNLSTVQFLVLLALHGQRSPYGAGAWSQVRYAITLCIELGLHRKRTANAPNLSPRDSEIRRRAFWCCYCLDRATSLLLGRTFAIADRDINVELPGPTLELWDLTSTESAPEGETGWSNILPFVHMIRLSQIQSKVHRTVFRVDKDVFKTATAERERLDGKIAAIQVELDEWVRTIPNAPRNAKCITWMYDPESTYHHDSRDFFHLQYHKTILSLFTALLPTLSTNDQRFISGAKSAASVCIAYKRLNQQKTLSYTITALHSLFIAGLTLVYCMWRDPSLFSFNALEATRACSLCLTIFGEKWPGAVKYRDIFDALSASLLKSIVAPSQPAAAAGGAGDPGQDAPQQGRSGPQPLDLGLDTASLVPDAYADDTYEDPMTDRDVSINLEDLDGNVPGVASGATASRAAESTPGAGRTANSMILGAVKEAFMEVDEEAPGGWQGWKMFSEMVEQKDFATGDGSTLGGESMSAAGMQWDELGTGMFYGSFDSQLRDEESGARQTFL